VIGFAIAAGIGVIWRGAERLRRVPAIRAVQAISVLLVLAAAAPPVYRFFSQQQARRPDLDTHLLWFAFQEIESTPALRNAPRLCVGGGAATTERMRMLHIRDAWSFYLPGKTIEPALLRPEAARNELYLSTTCEASTAPEAWTGKLYCSQSEPFVCPGPETRAADVRIFVDGRLAPSR
jgi:hypothetical protein